MTIILRNNLLYNQQHTIIYSVKGHQLAKKREIEDDIERGLDLTKKRKLDDRITETQFSDLNEKPLGSVPNILFWNDQQEQISTQIEKMKPTLLKGDYGTGLCHIIMSSY